LSLKHYPFELKTGTPATPAIENICTDLSFSTPFTCELKLKPHFVHGQTGKWTWKPGKQEKPC